MKIREANGDDSEETTPLNIEELPLNRRSTSTAYSQTSRRHRGFTARAKAFLSSSSGSVSHYNRNGRRYCWRSPRAFYIWLIRATYLIFLALGLIIGITAILFPSYTNQPFHYRELRDSVKSSTTSGRANVNSERIFVAASLYDPDGGLVGGKWGELVRELVHLLGPDNTFVSIFESDSGDNGTLALQNYENAFPCDHKFVSVEEIQLEYPAIITLPDGAESVRRIEYLAQARNHALSPMMDKNAPKYDKVLFLNDVIFDPIEVTQLLFSTNIQPNGRTSYKAACAQDFKSPFLMYDMLATRDSDGWQLGVPLFPWFSTAASGKSRRDAMNQLDAVEVKSCWGGMVAFEARYFQEKKPKAQGDHVDLPIRFRSEQDLFHESSECCLVHADLLELPSLGGKTTQKSTEIYMNPYVRTAYDETTFNWLWLGRRLERLLPILQRVITYYAGLPYFNARREVKTGELLEQILYHSKDPKKTGQWKVETAPAHPGSYCAIVNLMVKRLDRDKEKSNWETMGPEAREEMLKIVQDGS